MTRPPRVTLHDVASRAEVSIATASRALNGLTVAKESLERVERAAAELGYVANEAARSLRSDKTLTLGLIFFELASVRGLDLLDALSATVEEGGYSLLISTARGDPGAYDTLMRKFLERRVDGLFCVHARGEGASLPRYAAAGTPVLVIGHKGAAFRALPCVQSAFQNAMNASAEDLLREGHRRIAWIEDDDPPSLIAAGAPTWESGPFKPEQIRMRDYSGMEDLVTQLLARPERPTAIAAMEPQAAEFLAACRLAGVAVPGTFSVAAVGNLAEDRRAQRLGLSSMVIDTGVLGRAAGEAMLSWLGGKAPAGDIPVDTATWVRRATTGPVAG